MKRRIHVHSNRVEFMFSYGMNTHIASMMLRCRRAKLLGKATLPNYRLEFRYHLDIGSSKFDFVEGALWQIDPEDLELMDQVEGFPEYYTRYKLEPYIHYHNVYPAWTYFMVNKSPLMFPDQRYLDLVVEGYANNDINMSQLDYALKRCELENAEIN